MVDTIKKKKLLVALVFTIVLVCARLSIASVEAQKAPPRKIGFVADIEPILQRNCYQCHGPSRQNAGLRLDSRGSALAKVIIPGKASESTLYQRIAGLGDQARMPLGGQLDAKQIASIKQWIDEGAEWPGEPSAKTAEPTKHWAFIAPVRPGFPETNP